MNTKITGLFLLFILLVATFATAQDELFSCRRGIRNRVYEGAVQRYHTFDVPGIRPNTSPNELDNPNAATSLSPILPDFQVNENAGPCGTYQLVPVTSKAANGTFIIAWFDFRNGGRGDIFAQQFTKDGIPTGSNFQVNDRAGMVVQLTYISIAIDENDNFVIAWEDERNGKSDIYAQRYTSDEIALGDNFKVNDDDRTGDQFLPSVIAAGNSGFVITWMSDINWYPDIYAQRYADDGTALGNNFKVNDDDENVLRASPSIASDRSGNFLITWQDYRNGNSDIYAQQYAADGTADGKNLKINDDTGFTSQRSPFASMIGDSNYVILWQDKRSNENEIYAQHVASDGIRSGDNFKINCDEAIPHRPYRITVNKNGSFVMTWSDEREGVYNIYAQRIFRDGTASGNAFIVSDVPQNGYPITSPAIASDSSDNFAIVWADSRNGEYDIFAQQYSQKGIADGGNFKINDDEGSAFQLNSAIATDGNGNFVITWKDYRNGNIDVYAQRYSSDGTALGNNFKANNVIGSTFEFAPSVSADGNGNFVITWEDSSDHDFNIFAQRYSSDGTALGDNFKVNDDQENAGQFDPAISSDGSGNFVIAWLDGRNGHNKDIYVQRFSSDGTVLESNLKVNDDAGNPAQFDPAISSDPNGNFVITWKDYRNGSSNSDIYAQRYSNDGIALGSNFKVNDDEGRAYQYSPAIATDANGNCVITWIDGRNENYDIFVQHFSSDGTALGSNLKVNDDEGIVSQSAPSISADELGNFVITWTDYRNGTADIHAQRYLNDGTEKGSNFRITNTSEKNQSAPAVKLWKSRIYTTWTDNRAGGTGKDIWANVLNWENPTSIDSEEPCPLPSIFRIYQNYPNPFNAHTKIKFALPEQINVKIEIFNIVGEKVCTLIDEERLSGNYEIHWNADSYSSGAYFIRIEAGKFREIKKMLLLR